jgi:hypothetical protein
MPSNGRRRHLRLYDFRDLDLMLKLADMGGGTTLEIAAALGFGSDVQPVAARLTWMDRFGMLDRDEKGGWDLSEGGIRVVKAKLTAARGMLDKLPDESMIEAMAYITQRYYRNDPMLGHMLRREFLYGTKPQ